MNTAKQVTASQITPSRFEFDEFGVNNRYNTERQEAEFLRLQNKQLIEYAERHLEIALEAKEIKQKFKDLDRDFKERGFDVATSKRVLKAFMKELQKTPEDIETEEIVKEWLASSSKVRSLIQEIAEFDEDAKIAWEEQAGERQKARMDFTKKHFQERRKLEEEAGLGWIDFEVERLSKLVHLGHTESIPKLEEMKRQVQIRNERREQGLPMLPEHDQPAYPDQWLERKEKERQERQERQLQETQANPNKWANYQEPDDVKSISDEELKEYAEFANYRWEKNGGSHFRFYVDLIAEELKKREAIKRKAEKKERGEFWKAQNLKKLEELKNSEVSEIQESKELETQDVSEGWELSADQHNQEPPKSQRTEEIKSEKDAELEALFEDILNNNY